ncbi:MAG: SRPBCC domain-containing protein [Phycisphaerae bacterium]|nr:SRPBCC domain-containing protein [Gemmatimonadaceae bacterium]
MTAPDIGTTTQVYRIFIKATPQAIWDAITKPEWTQQWGYGLRDEYDLRPGGEYRGHASESMKQFGMTGVIVDGAVIEANAPHKLVITWRMFIDQTLRDEGFTTLTYEIEAGRDGVTRLSVVHDVAGTPGHGAMIAGDKQGPGAGAGWMWILSDLKSMLEIGGRMTL